MSAEPKTVLVVDDEPLFVRSLADGLRPLGERDGFVVLTATNGRDAVAALQSEQVDLVLTDLRMPGMDGFQLISWMIAQKRNVPVVVMTAMPSFTSSSTGPVSISFIAGGLSREREIRRGRRACRSACCCSQARLSCARA